jgi:hypothetical protein
MKRREVFGLLIGAVALPAYTWAQEARKSAMQSVQRCGYDLVPHRKSRGKPATWRDIAKLDFTPLTRTADMKPNELIPADATLQSCGVPARLAYAVMLRTREELIEMHGKLDHDYVDKMCASFAGTAETLKAIVAMLDAAYLRVLASASARIVRKGKFKGVPAAATAG